MSYHFKLEQFEGPLDLLLKLIEEEKLDITTVSLSKVADEYLQYIRQLEHVNAEELADFLVVAAKLLLLKSRTLLPLLQPADEDEADLETQLKMYREYQIAAKAMQALIGQKRYMYVREANPALMEPIFSPPPSLDATGLRQIMLDVIAKIEPIVHIPDAVIERTMSIQEKITQISGLLRNAERTNFRSLLGEAKNKTEIIVTFLALLELIKQGDIQVQQSSTFEEISITMNNNEEVADNR